MINVSTFRAVLMMFAVGPGISLVIAILQGAMPSSPTIATFPLHVFLVPALVAYYYQRMHDITFDKSERKRIADWYIFVHSLIGVTALVTMVYASLDKLQEPLFGVVAALVFAVVSLTAIGYLLYSGSWGKIMCRREASPTSARSRTN